MDAGEDRITETGRGKDNERLERVVEKGEPGLALEWPEVAGVPGLEGRWPGCKLWADVVAAVGGEETGIFPRSLGGEGVGVPSSAMVDGWRCLTGVDLGEGEVCSRSDCSDCDGG